MDSLNERQIEQFARAYREGIFGKVTDERGWDNCKEHWIRDTKAFIAKLAEAGLQVVEIKTEVKKKPVSPVDERGGGRFA